MTENLKIIISGGGTGGHVFPAIAIADALKNKYPKAEILFIGANNRLEMKKVPEAGYQIIGLPIRGLQRKINLKIFKTLTGLIKSIRKSKKIIKKYKPNIVIGVGGYASAPIMHVAAKAKIPTLIQEQNSYPGITNKILSKKASAICVAYQNMEKFFDKNKIFITGNPIRKLNNENITKNNALKYFGLKNNKKTMLVTGGSLGAETINNSIMKNFNKIINAEIQVIWQTGQKYYEKIEKFYENQQKKDGIIITKFINRMDFAYKIADIVISRAGAISISELAALGKASILVPSPNVAEDHQTKNAQALVNINAAIMIKDNEAENSLINKTIQTINQKETLKQIAENIRKYAKPNATKNIIEIIENILKKNNVKYA